MKKTKKGLKRQIKFLRDLLDAQDVLIGLYAQEDVAYQANNKIDNTRFHSIHTGLSILRRYIVDGGMGRDALLEKIDELLFVSDQKIYHPEGQNERGN